MRIQAGALGRAHCEMSLHILLPCTGQRARGGPPVRGIANSRLTDDGAMCFLSLHPLCCPPLLAGVFDVPSAGRPTDAAASNNLCCKYPSFIIYSVGSWVRDTESGPRGRHHARMTWGQGAARQRFDLAWPVPCKDPGDDARGRGQIGRVHLVHGGTCAGFTLYEYPWSWMTMCLGCHISSGKRPLARLSGAECPRPYRHGPSPPAP
jgi:hypothetical protein